MMRLTKFVYFYIKPKIGFIVDIIFLIKYLYDTILSGIYMKNKSLEVHHTLPTTFSGQVV